MQQEKENMALEKLSALLPQMGVAVLVAVLKETEFEVEPAVTMLRAFNTELEDKLKILHKVSQSLYLLMYIHSVPPRFSYNQKSVCCPFQ